MTYSLKAIADVSALAQELIGKYWTDCTAFALEGTPATFLHVGGGEWRACRQEDGRIRQVESITFGWCDQAKAEQYIRQTLDPAFDFGTPSDITDRVRLEHYRQHSPCRHCR